MELFEEQLTLHVPNWGLRVKVNSDSTSDMIRALKDHLTDSSILSVLSHEDNYQVCCKQTISADCRYILDCVSKDYWRSNKIPAIKLVRKVFNCDLRPAKDAVEEYLA